MFPVVPSSVDRYYRWGEGEHCRSCNQLFVHCPGFRLDDDARFCPVLTSDTCKKCKTPCCRFKETRDRALTQIGGLRWERYQPYPGLELPPLVWRLHRTNWGLPLQAVSIPGHRILNVSGAWSRVDDLRERFGVPRGTLLGVDWYVHDPVLDTLASKPLREVTYQLRRYDLSFMVAPNFASYSNHPSLSNSISLRRRTLFAQAVAEAGIPVIPDVSHSHPLERYRLMEEAAGHPYAAITYQTVKLRGSRDAWRRQVENQVGFYQKLGSKSVWAGCHGARAKAVLQSFPGAVLLDTRVYRLSEFRKDLDGNKVFATRREAWEANTTTYAERISRWRALRTQR